VSNEQRSSSWNLNGRTGPLVLIFVSMLLAGATAYWTGRLAISEDLGKRPIREEVERKITSAQKVVMRELDTIKVAQKDVREDIRQLQRTLNQVLIQVSRRLTK